ncbi:unnamed protein product [Discula destructiva]
MTVKRVREPSPAPTSSSAKDSEPHKRQKKHKKQQVSTKRTAAQTPVIPDRLQDVIRKSKYGFFELTFLINHLNGLQRLAWGNDHRAESIIVCIRFGLKNKKDSDHALFCVHLRSDDEGRHLRARHRFSSTKGDSVRAIMTPCTARSNIMTIVLGRELHQVLGSRGCRKLDVIYDNVAKIIKSTDPTKSCLICDKKFGVKIYTPTACLGNCLAKFEKWPLRARLSHLLTDVKSLDFLLCSIYTAVDGQKQVPTAYGTISSLLVGCPLELEQVQPAIDSFPALSDRLSMKDMLKEGESKVTSAHRKQLLSWVTQRFRGCMIALKPEAELLVKGKRIDDVHQFMVLNACLERQEKFADNINKLGVGSVAFHGCKAPRTFNILADASRDPSKLPYPRTDQGVFFASEPNTSLRYAAGDGTFKAWKASQFSVKAGWLIVFGIEVAWPDVRINYRRAEASTRDESRLMIRYIFMAPSSILHGRNDGYMISLDQAAMKAAYKVLDEGKLSSQHIGLSEARVSEVRA